MFTLFTKLFQRITLKVAILLSLSIYLSHFITYIKKQKAVTTVPPFCLSQPKIGLGQAKQYISSKTFPTFRKSQKRFGHTFSVEARLLSKTDTVAKQNAAEAKLILLTKKKKKEVKVVRRRHKEKRKLNV